MKQIKLGEVIAILGLIVAVMTIVIDVTTPEIRCLLGLQKDSCGVLPDDFSRPSITSSPASTPTLDPLSSNKSETPESQTISSDNSEYEISELRYDDLEKLLLSKNYIEADKETAKILAENFGITRPRIDNNTGCQILLTVTNLWENESNGRFGLTAQVQELDNTAIYLRDDDDELTAVDLRRIGNAIGWRKDSKWLNDSEIIYNSSAPRGHLPWLWRIYQFNTLNRDNYGNSDRIPRAQRASEPSAANQIGDIYAYLKRCQN